MKKDIIKDPVRGRSLTKASQSSNYTLESFDVSDSLWSFQY